MVLRRRAAILSLVLGIPLVVVGVVASVWGWDLLVPLVALRASAALGRPVTISHIHVRPGRIVEMTADDIAIGNPPDWTGEPLARVERLRVQFDAWEYLWNRRIVVPLVAMERPLMTATQLPNGAANYKLQLAGGSDGSDVRIGEIRIDDGRAHVRLARLRADFMIGIRTEKQNGQPQVVAEARGTYDAQPITARLVGGALLSLQDTSHPWPIDLKLQNGQTRMSLVGTVLDPMALQGANLKLQLSGPDMAQLSELTGLPVPRTPNYELAGQVDFAEKRVQLRNLNARVGSSDVSGTVEVDPKVEPPELVASLTSRQLDLADLGGVVGAEPGRADTPGQTATQRTQIVKQEASPRLLPDTPINLPKLRWANIHLQYRGQSFRGGKSVPLDNLDVRLDVVDGKVSVHPVSFGVGKGSIKATVEMTPQDTDAHVAADVEFQRVDVSRLMVATGAFQGAGSISGSGSIDAVGASLSQMATNGHGGLKLAMVGGDLSALLVDLSGLHFGKALLSALGLPQRTNVECFITTAILEGGSFKIQALILDTGEATITGTGGANLRDERLDMQLRTDAKHFTIGSLPTPINIGGTLKAPSIMPGAELAARGGVAAGLGILFPPLALLPTIQFGSGDDNRCARVLARTKEQTGVERSPPRGGQGTHR